MLTFAFILGQEGQGDDRLAQGEGGVEPDALHFCCFLTSCSPFLTSCSRSGLPAPVPDFLLPIPNFLFPFRTSCSCS